MRLTPELTDVVRQWVQLAEEDLLTAEHTLNLGQNCPLRTVCFHAQQCVEKYIKALLTLRGVPFPKSHDLRMLMGLAQTGGSLGLSAEEAVTLSIYAVDVRYPGFLDNVARGEADRAVATARQVRDVVRALLSPEMLIP